MSNSVKLYRYNIPSVAGQGWAIVVIGSDGYFSTVSDWGNYSYLWSHHRKDDFRKFIINCNSDYIMTKLNPNRVLDYLATQKGLKKIVLNAYRHKHIDIYDAREAFNAISGVHNEIELNHWLDHYPGDLPDEYWECFHTKPDPQVLGFVTHILPRLKDIIKGEMSNE